MNKYKQFSKVKKARKARRRENMCEKKRRYETQEEAAEGSGSQVVYKCGYCNGWHRSGQHVNLNRKLSNRKKH